MTPSLMKKKKRSLEEVRRSDALSYKTKSAQTQLEPVKPIVIGRISKCNLKRCIRTLKVIYHTQTILVNVFSDGRSRH